MSDNRYRTLRADTQKRRVKITKKRLGALLLTASMAMNTVALGGYSSGKPTETKAATEAAAPVTGDSKETDTKTTDTEAAEAAAPATEGKSAADYKIVLILPKSINDQSWNATNYAGLVACNETLGTNMEYVENVQASDYGSTLHEYAEKGYGLIMVAGSQFDKAVGAVAPNYPDTTLCAVNDSKCDGDNVAPIFPKEYEASYVAPIIAGYVMENGNFATIGGFPNEPMEHPMDVYGKNAVAIAKERGISEAKATRAYTNSWDDTALDKQMAEQMINNGADTLFMYANEVELDCIEAAKTKEAKFIGSSSNQITIDPNTVVASVNFDFKSFYTWTINQYMEGKLSGDMVHEAGISEDIFVPVYTDNIADEVKAMVDQGLRDFKDGGVDLQAMFEK